MKTLGIFEVKTKLSQICDEVESSGEGVIVTKRGRPFVRIEPIERTESNRSEVWEARERYTAQMASEDEIKLPKRVNDPFANPFQDVDK